jgi:hypothetical protein
VRDGAHRQEPHLVVVAHGIAGIDDQAEHHLLDLHGIADHDREVWRHSH